jgi:hypothetical protein
MLAPIGRLLSGVLLAVLLPSSPRASELTLSLPDELSEGTDVAGWEQFGGHAAIGSQDIAYVLYVDPRYPALYRLTRYQITIVTKTAEGRDVRSVEDEKLIWNSQPGSREPLRCYTLLRASAEPSRWQPVPWDSEGYRNTMHTVVSLYQHHQRMLEGALP